LTRFDPNLRLARSGARVLSVLIRRLILILNLKKRFQVWAVWGPVTLGLLSERVIAGNLGEALMPEDSVSGRGMGLACSLW
jgi:hypothetical protein